MICLHMKVDGCKLDKSEYGLLYFFGNKVEDVRTESVLFSLLYHVEKLSPTDIEMKLK